ncbi:MAG TPA: acyl-CoA thioesterase/bile acid-CoA:amino acid N-acyltransferase family protein [Gaiellaceae bacterium]|jgi:dienelactone hydrolase
MLGSLASLAGAVITVSPASALVDRSVDVRVVGLPARAPVTLTASTVDYAGNAWTSRVTFRSNRRGVVDTHSDMRLFWSMQPRKESLAKSSFLPADGPRPVAITADVRGRTVATGELTRRLRAADVTQTETTLAHEGFVGSYYAAPPRRPAAALMVIGGSVGGHGEGLSGLLASRGHPTLSLGYFGEPGLPRDLHSIPLEYFAKALRWLAVRPGVDPGRIVVMGVSRGGEAALLLGATFPELVHGVVSCDGSWQVLGAFSSSSNIAGPAWTYGGKAVPYGAIPVERIAAPLLAFGAGDDAVWDSKESVRRIVARARAYGRRDVVGRVYPNAGHGAGCLLPNVPHPGWLTSPATATRGSISMQLGGTPEGNARAADASWPMLLSFLDAVP